GFASRDPLSLSALCYKRHPRGSLETKALSVPPPGTAAGLCGGANVTASAGVRMQPVLHWTRWQALTVKQNDRRLTRGAGAALPSSSSSPRILSRVDGFQILIQSSHRKAPARSRGRRGIRSPPLRFRGSEERRAASVRTRSTWAA